MILTSSGIAVAKSKSLRSWDKIHSISMHPGHICLLKLLFQTLTAIAGDAAILALDIKVAFAKLNLK